MEGRKKPFTEYERDFIINLVLQNKDIIENKKCDGVTIHKKNAAWADIVGQYNACSRTTQKVDIKQMKKFWNNLKMKAKDAKTKENIRCFAGGGPAMPDIDSENITVLSSLNNNVLPCVEIVESNGIESHKNDSDDEFWSRLKNQVIKTIPIKEEDAVASTSRTDDSSEVNDSDRPPPPKVTKQISTQDRREDKKRVEDLKIKMLEQDYQHKEIKFQREMDYMRQIREIEINTKREEMAHKARLNYLIEEEFKLKLLEKQNNTFPNRNN